MDRSSVRQEECGLRDAAGKEAVVSGQCSVTSKSANEGGAGTLARASCNDPDRKARSQEWLRHSGLLSDKGDFGRAPRGELHVQERPKNFLEQILLVNLRGSADAQGFPAIEQ